MGALGFGYGSEWQILRYLGRHRHSLNTAALRQLGDGRIDWLDFPFHPNGPFHDAEWKGLDFLSGQHSALCTRWLDEWPQTGNVMNWDAVGWLHRGREQELLLVEAKSHLAEIRSTCGAREHGGLPKIRRFLNQAKHELGLPERTDWLRPHYQFCNRVAMLRFLRRHGLPTRLLFIYFTGDNVPGRQCPATEADWQPALAELRASVLRDAARPLEFVHEIFLPVAP